MLSYFHSMFYKMPQIFFEYSLDCLRTFRKMFNDISRNVWRHSPHSLRSPHSVPRSCIPGFIHSLTQLMITEFDKEFLIWKVSQDYLFVVNKSVYYEFNYYQKLHFIVHHENFYTIPLWLMLFQCHY